MMKLKILFLSNKRSIPHGDYSVTLESGLVNSIRFIVDMLNSRGYDAHYKQVDDSNHIDREVAKHKPDLVVIEALWVPPAKLIELQHLHPHVFWVVRIHSELPFLANEGVAFQWLFDYAKIPCVNIATNSHRAGQELNHIIGNIAYLPNWYGGKITDHGRKPFASPVLDIGCFGAIRPMKNQLMQAVGAILFADSLERPMHFHVNINREETGGSPVLKNLRSLFEHSESHSLIEHPWSTHDEFIKIISAMDISMQVSFSETFNIVTADAVANYVPVAVSQEIKWLERSKCLPNSAENIATRMMECVTWIGKDGNKMLKENLENLVHYNEHSVECWDRFMVKIIGSK